MGSWTSEISGDGGLMCAGILKGVRGEGYRKGGGMLAGRDRVH